MSPTSIQGNLLHLRDPRVDAIVMNSAGSIDTVAHVLGIDPHYLSIQVRLHIPYYDEAEHGDGIPIIREILQKLRANLDSFGSTYETHRELNEIDLLPRGCDLTVSESGALYMSPPDNSPGVPVRFGSVPERYGLSIQERLHYIHKARKDTDFHFGMFLGDATAPVSYVAFSTAIRQYLVNALVRSIPGYSGNSNEVIVMTRAFGYSPLPKNTMSKMFDCAAAALRDEGFSYIVTAMNPFLGFRGSIFSGSSFQCFATSPMRYWYGPTGAYLNRRSAESAQPQKYDTPPIIWAVKGLNRYARRRLSASTIVYNIAHDEYDAG